MFIGFKNASLMHRVCNLQIYHNDQYRLYGSLRNPTHTAHSDRVPISDTSSPSPFPNSQHHHSQTHFSTTTKRPRYKPSSRPIIPTPLDTSSSRFSSHIALITSNYSSPSNSASHNYSSTFSINPIQTQLDLILAKLVDLEAIKQ